MSKVSGLKSLFTEFIKSKFSETRNDKENSSSIFDINRSSNKEVSISIDDILNMDFSNGQLINENNNDEFEEEDNESKNEIVKLINEYLSDDDVISKLDSDGDGELSKSELDTFLNKIKGNDKNGNNISIEDLYEASSQIGNDDFEYSKIEGQKEEKTEKNAETTGSGEGGSQNISSGGGISGANGSGASTMASSSAGLGSVEVANSYENMTIDELNNEMSDAENGIKEGQNALNEVLNGTALADFQQAVDDAYQEYQNQLELVNVDMAAQLDELTKNEQAKQKEQDSKKLEISNQKSLISDLTSQHDSAVQTVQSLESTLSSLQSALSGAEEEEQAAIEAQIASVQAQLDAAKAEEQRLQAKLDEAKNKLSNELEPQLTQIETELADIQTQTTDLEQQIAMQYPEILNSQMKYNEAKTALSTEKTQKEQEANSYIEKNENIKRNVQAELTTRENKDKEKENTTSIKNMYDEEMGKNIADAASVTRGTTGLCLAGVSDSLHKIFGGERLAMLGSAYKAAEALRGNVEGYEELASNFREVEVSESELSSLPAGAVVVWNKGGNSSVSQLGKEHGHISISLGNGKESSDHIQNQITGRGTDFTVFMPV